MTEVKGYDCNICKKALQRNRDGSFIGDGIYIFTDENKFTFEECSESDIHLCNDCKKKLSELLKKEG